MSRRVDQSPIFGSGAARAVELRVEDVPALQEFFDANPEYFVLVTGEPPRHDEGHEEFHDEVPPGMSFTRKWMIGFVSESGDLIAISSVVSDLLAKHVWHIGLFVVATQLHGSGAANAMYAQLESWMRDHGAQWLRLGVVEGNARAERFWEKAGYREVRKRSGVEMGARTNVIRVMAKSLAGGTLEEYLVRVARDRPE